MSPLPAGSRVFADADALAEAAAARIVVLAQADRHARLAICLSGGSTPRGVYTRLAEASGLPWDRIHWFWGDERLVPPDHRDSNAGMARQAMLARAPAPNIHPIPTVGLSAGEAADVYAAELVRFYGAAHLDPARPLFTLTLLGLGEDGHTASLFPGTDAARETVRWAMAVPVAGQPPFVPRITLTPPALASSGLVLFLVVGAAKRDALTRIAAGEDLPAGRVAETAAGRCEWWLDAQAAGEEHR